MSLTPLEVEKIQNKITEKISKLNGDFYVLAKCGGIKTLLEIQTVPFAYDDQIISYPVISVVDQKEENKKNE